MDEVLSADGGQDGPSMSDLWWMAVPLSGVSVDGRQDATSLSLQEGRSRRIIEGPGNSLLSGFDRGLKGAAVCATDPPLSDGSTRMSDKSKIGRTSDPRRRSMTFDDCPGQCVPKGAIYLCTVPDFRFAQSTARTRGCAQ